MIYLVRHAAHRLVDRVLCGRSRDVSLSSAGRQQARALAHQLGQIHIDAVQSSPRRRCRETAAPIARRHALAVDCADRMDELDAGEWSGRSFESLAGDPAWQDWNDARGSARPPGGESMAELQRRVVAHIEELLAEGVVAVIVSHAEPIRAALLHYRDMPLHRFHEIDVPPASVTVLPIAHTAADERLSSAIVSS